MDIEGFNGARLKSVLFSSIFSLSYAVYNLIDVDFLLILTAEDVEPKIEKLQNLVEF